jgi:hypothetical protein
MIAYLDCGRYRPSLLHGRITRRSFSISTLAYFSFLHQGSFFPFPFSPTYTSILVRLQLGSSSNLPEPLVAVQAFPHLPPSLLMTRMSHDTLLPFNTVPSLAFIFVVECGWT